MHYFLQRPDFPIQDVHRKISGRCSQTVTSYTAGWLHVQLKFACTKEIAQMDLHYNSFSWMLGLSHALCSCSFDSLSRGTYLTGEEVDDLKWVFDNPDSHELLAIVAAMHHQWVGETLHNGTLEGRERETGDIHMETKGSWSCQRQKEGRQQQNSKAIHSWEVSLDRQ